MPARSLQNPQRTVLGAEPEGVGVDGGLTSLRDVTAPFVDRLRRRGNAYRTRCPHLEYADALRRGS